VCGLFYSRYPRGRFLTRHLFCCYLLQVISTVAGMRNGAQDNNREILLVISRVVTPNYYGITTARISRCSMHIFACISVEYVGI